MSRYIVALSKGELARGTEEYIRGYGLSVNLQGRPLEFQQQAENIIFRVMRPRQIPWYVSTRGDYGITGSDMVETYISENGTGIEIIKKLGFGKGNLVMFGKKSMNEIKQYLERRPVIVTFACYVPLLDRGVAVDYIDAFNISFMDYTVLEVDGSTEGFVVDGTADVGFDFSTYFIRPVSERACTTISRNGLIVLENILPVEAVVVVRDLPEFTFSRFEQTLRKV